MTAPELDRAGVIARNVGVGCVTTVAGFFGGGMIAVFIGKVVGSALGCRPPEGLPACNWWVYAGIGAVLGALTLPGVVLIRLNQARPGK
jgi:hypothetical protein